MDAEDIREELLHVKKAHHAVLRENSQYRTKLRIAERERNRREEELKRLLTVPQQTKTLNNNKLSPHSTIAENRIEMMTLKRKVLLYERLLKEKTRENSKLLEDKKVVEAAETRKLTERLENECQRLRIHLAQSVPETEFLKEKDQYLTIINRLIDENMHLRQVVGKFEQKRKESEKLLTELGGGEALVRQFRTMSINTRKQANFYKKALNNLMTKGRIQQPSTSSRRPTLASTSSLSGKLKNLNLNGSKSHSSLNNFNENNLRRDISSKNFDKNSKRRASSLESSKASKSVNIEKTNLKNIENEILGISLESEGQENENFNEKTSSNHPSPQSNLSLITCVRRTKRSPSDTSKIDLPKNEEFEENLEEENEDDDKKSYEDVDESDFKHFEDTEEENEELREEGEDEEEDEEEESIHHVSEESDEKEIEDMEDEDTHLNALYRLISSHVLRQQMCKVREERDPYSKQSLVGVLQQEQQNYYW
ncbi:hypothetical protein ACQ4LE_010340 [Meloidogyne hapla]